LFLAQGTSTFKIEKNGRFCNMERDVHERIRFYARLSDAELLSAVDANNRTARHSNVEVVASLAELDARGLYRGLGYSSLYTYCTQHLQLSEHEAHTRKEAARAARQYRAFQRVQELRRHSIPSGDPGQIVGIALQALLRDVERRKLADVHRPRSNGLHVSETRHVPAAVKRAVWARDKAQCAFVGTEGRCQERGFLELHHIVPFAEGGVASSENLQLRCRTHNVYAEELRARGE
jgi:hypothetical protein